jgi:hypothetical protein
LGAVTNSIITTGITGNTYRTLFRRQMLRTKPAVFGMAVAYVSASGFGIIKKIFDESDVGEVRLVTDTKDGVTHPKALQHAVDSGWNVRVVNTLAGTFHPKLYVGAAAFDNSSGFSGISMTITGSPNLSHAGFFSNGECAFWSAAPHIPESAGKAWLDCWNLGAPLTTAKLNEYEKHFAARNRYRNPGDLVALGVADSVPATARGVPKKGLSPPKPEQKTISEAVASVAWAGLQSFTGEYMLQLEFPKEAGIVLRRLFGRLAKGGTIELLCVDGGARTFKYKYYDDNGMFRLNIPNSTPLVDWARVNKSGIGYIEQTEDGGLYFEIVPPGPSMTEVVDRSLALGTWGRTSTRLYGWY